MADKYAVSTKRVWMRVAVGIGIVGCLLAVGNSVPLPGLDPQAVTAVAKCDYGSGGMLPIYHCFNWPAVLTDPLSIQNAPLILPLVLVIYPILWARQRITGR